jgi:type II secretory pathway pseudopilin PulG
MVVLLVVMAIMAVGTAALLPTWRQQMIREHEEELIFRGNQLARALVLYARKNNNVLPANIDVLYDGKFLRKKYKDPITGEDFGLMGPGMIPGTAGRGAPASGRGAAPGSGRASTPSPSSGRGTQVVGSIQGFYSTSTDNSIKLYQNQSRYIDWPFTVQTAQAFMGLPSGRRGGGPFGGDQGRQGGPTRGGGPEGRPGGPGGGPGGRGGIQPPGGRTGGGQPPSPPPVIRRGGGGGL